MLSVFIIPSLLVALASLPSTESANWAVLVAGSSGWDSYRHQANVAHAYQILRMNGFPQSNVITFMYDDVARDKRNPFPNKLFNDYAHVDVYGGIKIDYKAEDVTPENFLAVLEGNETLKAKNRKVLDSGPDDNVFVYYTGHGHRKHVMFPNDTLHALELNATLTKMFESKKYNKMVIYMAGCFSGSMFEGILSSNINIYAITAAKPTEPATASHCHDRTLNVCLTDEFSISWLYDSETHNLSKRSFDQQYRNAFDCTPHTHVSLYGNLGIGSMPVADFQATGKVKYNIYDYQCDPNSWHPTPEAKAYLVPLYRKLSDTRSSLESKKAHLKLAYVLQLEDLVKKTFEYIETSLEKEGNLSSRTMLEKLECFKKTHSAYTKNCFSVQRHREAAANLHKLDVLCERGVEVQRIIHTIEDLCQ